MPSGNVPTSLNLTKKESGRIMELQTKMQRLVSAMDSTMNYGVSLDSANDSAKTATMTTSETNLVVY